MVTALLQAPSSSGETRRKSPDIGASHPNEKTRRSPCVPATTAGYGGEKKGGVFAFLGSKLMRFSGWRTSERWLPHIQGRRSRRTDGRRHHKTLGRVAAESLDSNQWQIATELKKATDADPHRHSPLIWLQSNPALNPRLRSERRRSAVGQQAAGVGVQNRYRKHTCFVLGTSTKATLSSSSSSQQTVTRGRKRTSRQGWGCGSRARAPARVLPPSLVLPSALHVKSVVPGLGRSRSHFEPRAAETVC